MQLIFVDRRMTRARTLTVTPGLIIGAATGMLAVFLLSLAVAYALTFHLGVQSQIPFVHDFLGGMVHEEADRREQYTRDNIGALARKLGEIQAQIMRLDALGERVSKIAGIRPEEFNFRDLPGRGGPAPETSQYLTLDQLQAEMGRTAKQVESRGDYMDVVESELLQAQVRRALLPQNTPVPPGFVGSGYGMRVDPFTGQWSMHPGLDFAAPMGTPIYAAAGGVVTTAELNPSYGRMVEIDHGKGLSTVYGHASRLVVKPGDIVRRGQKIAEVGTTGRSTGPHLHFEVRVNGTPQNPSRFLAAQRPESPLAALAPESAADKAKAASHAAAASQAESLGQPAVHAAVKPSISPAREPTPTPGVRPQESARATS